MHDRSHYNAGLALSCSPLLLAYMMCGLIQGFCNTLHMPHLQARAGLLPTGQLADDGFRPGELRWAGCAAGRWAAPGECRHWQASQWAAGHTFQA